MTMFGARRRHRPSWLIALPLLMPALAHADGGVVLAHRESAPFAITVFAPGPSIAPGPADLSVLLQRIDGGGAILDARVTLSLQAPGDQTPAIHTLSHDQAIDKLLYAGTIDIPHPGVWRMEVTASRGGASARTDCLLNVTAPANPGSVWLPHVEFVFALVGLFALNRSLAARKLATSGVRDA